MSVSGKRHIKKRGGRTVVLNAPPSGMDVRDGPPHPARLVHLAPLAQEMLSAIKELKGSYLNAGGRADYGAIGSSAGYARYRELTTRLARVDPMALAGTSGILAFWINVYNALVADAIIFSGVKRSVKEVTGFYKRLKYRVGASEFSLDDIEHGILRANSRGYMRSLRQFGPFDARRAFALKKIDPRIHFALVCGALSCPPIKFYTPEGIDAELEMAAGSFINSPEVAVMPGEGRLRVSMIFKWYGADFGGRPGVLDFIGRYLDDEEMAGFVTGKGAKVKLEYLPYDWDLDG
jgi:hypothetical protein